jgi:hypothetical protein
MSFIFLEYLGPVQACNGIALPLPITCHEGTEGSRGIIFLFLELRQWGGGVKATPGRFTPPERGPVLNVQEAALLYFTAKFYIRFTSTDGRVLAESDVGV